MSTDKMQDVFPLVFDFKPGEQPDDVKLTKWAELTDLALERVTTVVGDPWDYTPHVNSSSVRYYLSINNLAQINLARFSGPSNLVSPGGNTLGQEIDTDMTVVLDSGRNTWSIGFPLCRSYTTGHLFKPNDNDVYLRSIDLTLINFVDSNLNPVPSLFGTPASTYLKNSANSITSPGEYYIDWRTGIITTYSIATTEITMNIPTSADLQFFGSGAPWTTHNVIPDWKEGNNSGVDVAYITDGAGLFTYNITMPKVNTIPRAGSPSELPGSPEVSVTPGAAIGSQYRMPYVLNSLGGSEVIPEGFVFLWDNETNSIVNLTTFSTGIYPNHLTTLVLTSPELPGVTTGTNSTRYRIITMGSSLAETLGYLSAVVRNNTHTGIASREDGAIPNTLAYTPPIKHSSLSERYGVISAIPTNDTSYLSKLNFVESKYPSNDHPQYLHRGGFMSQDIANSKNAMKGHIAFSSVDDFNIDTTGSYAGVLTRTYGITFGGGEMVSGSESAGPARITWEGGQNLVASSSGDVATRFGFGVNGIGLKGSSSPNYWGALTYTPYYTAPLYIRGSFTGDPTYPNIGGTIAFDVGQNAELNYITIRGNIGSNDPHIPARVSGQVLPNTPTRIMPGTSGKISSQQLREFRFRSVAYVPTAINNASYTKNDSTAIPEMDKYFVGPGVVGTDFLNVYSNAIMFSNSGDGLSTTMHSMFGNWLADPDNQDRPAGIFYEPNGNSSKFVFSVTNGSTTSEEPLKLGYSTHNYILNQTSVDGTLEQTGFFGDFGSTVPRTAIILKTTLTEPGGTSLSGDIDIHARNEINILGIEKLKLYSTLGDVEIEADLGSVNISSVSTVENSIVIDGSTNTIQLLSGGGSGMGSVLSDNELRLDSAGRIRLYSDESIRFESSDNLDLYAGNNATIEAKDGSTSILASNNIYIQAENTIALSNPVPLRFLTLNLGDLPTFAELEWGQVGDVYKDSSGFLKVVIA